MQGVFSNANGINLFKMIFPPHESPLQATVVPVQFSEYEYGLLLNAEHVRNYLTTDFDNHSILI